jgi:hypothetical protein
MSHILGVMIPTVEAAIVDYYPKSFQCKIHVVKRIGVVMINIIILLKILEKIINAKNISGNISN